MNTSGKYGPLGLGKYGAYIICIMFIDEKLVSRSFQVIIKKVEMLYVVLNNL